MTPGECGVNRIRAVDLGILARNSLVELQLKEEMAERDPELKKIIPNICMKYFFACYLIEGKSCKEESPLLGSPCELLDGEFVSFWDESLWLWAGLIPRIKILEEANNRVRVVRFKQHLSCVLYDGDEKILLDKTSRIDLRKIETSLDTIYVLPALRSLQEIMRDPKRAI